MFLGGQNLEWVLGVGGEATRAAGENVFSYRLLRALRGDRAGTLTPVRATAVWIPLITLALSDTVAP